MKLVGQFILHDLESTASPTIQRLTVSEAQVPARSTAWARSNGNNLDRAVTATTILSTAPMRHLRRSAGGGRSGKQNGTPLEKLDLDQGGAFGTDPS
jgi:uncharacterized protein